MTPKTATIRLYVALVSLVAAILEFCAALARLGAGLTLRATSAVRPHSGVTHARPTTRPNLRIITQPSDDLERGRLVVALTGMGWPVPAVLRFVDGLGDRVGREPIETLIKEGIAKLAA